MKLKDKALIKYFGKSTITEKIVQNHHNTLHLNFFENPSIDIDEVAKVFASFPSIDFVAILPKTFEQLEKVMERIPEGVKISLGSLTKEVTEQIPPEMGERVYRLDFFEKDKYLETMKVEKIVQKFPNAKEVLYPCLLSRQNITDLNQVTYLLERARTLDATPEMVENYQKFCEIHGIKDKASFGKQAIYNMKFLQDWNQDVQGQKAIPSGIVMQASDEQIQAWAEEEKTLVIYASTMADVPLSLAEKIKSHGVKAIIKMQRYDNSDEQNELYELDEYIALSKVMDELIGDIDINLPEEIRFRQIYERIVSYIAYDYTAIYPENKHERAYSKENRRNCRNLRNGLLYGKALCAGYADILKNACALKGIECEYVRGPVDTLENKESYYMKKKRFRDPVVFSDDKFVITRGYHAWNKVRINGVWYNVDPTWDREDIINHRVPTYAYLSDEFLRKLGRPTVEVLRHPCQTVLLGAEKNRMFRGLEPSNQLIANHRVMEYESTLDEYGEPRDLPAVTKEFPWTKIMMKLKEFAYEQQVNVKNLIRQIRTKKNSVPTKVISIPGKQPSWALPAEKLSEVKAVEHGQQKKETEIQTDSKQVESKEMEIGE